MQWKRAAWRTSVLGVATVAVLVAMLIGGGFGLTGGTASADGGQPLVVQAVKLAEPGDINSGEQDFPNDPLGVNGFTGKNFACAGDGACAMFTDYSAQNSGVETWLGYSSTGGTWSGPVTLPLPGGLTYAQAFATIMQISCPANGQCVAVGSYSCYQDNVPGCPDDGENLGLVETLQGGIWTAQEFGSSSRDVNLDGVACASISQCEVIGSTGPAGQGGSDPGFSFVTSGSVSDLAAAAAGIGPATYPGGATGGFIQDIACADNGTCALFGQAGNGGGFNSYVQMGTGGSWDAPAIVPTPAGDQMPQLLTVACNSNSCHAGGTSLSDDGNYTPHAVIMDSSGSGIWTEVDPGGGRIAQISCPLFGSCVASGEGNTSNDFDFWDDAGTWTTITAANGTPLIADAGGTFYCTNSGPCYTDNGYVEEETNGTALPVAQVIPPSDCSNAQAAADEDSPQFCQSDVDSMVGCAVTQCTEIGDYPDGNNVASYGVAAVTGSPVLSVGDASVLEPSSGDVTLNFPVSVSVASGNPITVQYTSSDGTATAGTDYGATSGTLTIPAGASTASIPVTVHASNVSSDRTLRMTLSGPSAGTSLAQASATGTITSRGPMKVTVQWLQNGQPIVLHQTGKPDQPDTIKLADTDSGEVPQNVVARVTVTNTSSYTEQNVSFNGTPPLSYHNPADARQQLPVSVTGGPTDPSSGSTDPSGKLPDLAPGSSVTRDYTVNVTNNGVFDLTPQVLSSDASTSKTRVSSGVGTITALPTALLWLTLKADATPVVPGGTLLVSGTLVNRSLTQTLDADPVIPTADGNISGWLSNSSSSSLADGVTPPFAGQILPGQTIDLIGYLFTSPQKSTTGTATFAESGSIVNADGSETRLTADQSGMSAGTSPLTVTIDNAGPAVDPGDQTFMGNFTASAAQGMGEWVLNNYNGLKSIVSNPITTLKGAAGGVSDFVVGGAQRATEVAYLASSIYGYAEAVADLTPAQRNQAEADIINDYQSTKLAGDYDKLKTAVQAMEQDVLDAYYKGDYAALGRISGAGTAAGLTSFEDAELSQIFFQKLALGTAKAGQTILGKAAQTDGFLAKGVQLATAIEDAKVEQVLGKGITGVDAGLNLLGDGAKILTQKFGLTTKQITELRNYCQRSNLIIAVRQRSAKAAKIIKEGLAIGKNEVIKLKAVNEVDVEFLGYHAADLNEVVYASPVNRAFVEQKLAEAGADQAVRDTVLQRYQTRVKEWHNPDYRKQILTSERSKKIKWGFDGSGNEADVSTLAERHFELARNAPPTAKSASLRPGTERTYRKVLVGNKPGLGKGIRLVPVTQDVDVMAILTASGELLDPEQRAAAYTHLMDLINMEHGETPTWIKNGEILFQAKVKQLADVVTGGEPLAVFNPKGGVTAGFFDPKLTVFDNTTKTGRIMFKGGYNDPYSLLKANISLAAKNFGAPK